MIGGIVFSILTVGALSIEARNTSYDNSNSGASATNMQDAIDDLYDKAGHRSTIIDCGTYTSSTASTTVDITEFYEDYQDLTASNIFISVTNITCSVAVGAGWGGTGYANPTWSYDNGIVTVSGLYDHPATNVSGPGLNLYVNSFKVYIIV